MKWTAWIVSVLVFVGVAIVLGTTHYGSPERPSRAVLQARSLLTACEVYRARPESDDKYPATLRDLVKPPWGGGAFLRNPQENLLDPWGNPFKYAVVQTDGGEPELYVWAERTADGKTRLIGAKRTASGATTHFGLE